MNALLVLLSAATLLSAAAKPNIVLIYADDLGYGDVQCYNPERGKIPTPHIDKLAVQGMENLITEGRNTPGEKQRNDIKVVRHPK